MATTQITFTTEQINYLREWFSTQSRQYVNTVMDDEFDADEENFQRLCDTTYNTEGFKIGEVSVKSVAKDETGGSWEA